MNRIETLITAALVLGAVFAPPATSSVQPWAPAGEWRIADVAGSRVPVRESSDEQWLTVGECGKLESEIRRGAAGARAAHRVLLTWTTLPAALRAGNALELSVAALVLEAAGRPDAEARVEIKVWRSGSYAQGATPESATTAVQVQMDASEPAGSVARNHALWQVPAPSETDPAYAGTLHLRAIVTHRGNVLTYTRSYAWVSPGITAPAASAD